MKDPCASLSRLLERYSDQEVTQEERSMVEGHLQGCSPCQDTLKIMAELKEMVKKPVDQALQNEDFPWVWQKIEREIRLQEKRTWRQSIRSWLDVSSLFKKRVWIPAVAAFAIFILISTQLFFKNMSSYSGGSVVEYVESQSYNVMVYNLEKAKVTVIWLFEEPEKGLTAS